MFPRTANGTFQWRNLILRVAALAVAVHLVLMIPPVYLRPALYKRGPMS